MGCARVILLGLTLLIWLAGSAFVGLSGYVMVKDMKFHGLTGNMPLDGSILGLACFVFVLGFLGCLGAALQKKSILKTFFAILLIFLLIQAALIIVYFVQKEQIEALLKLNWTKMDDKGRNSIQKELQCCGMQPGETFASYNDTSCFTNGKNPPRRNSCFKALDDWLKNNIIIVGACGGGLILIELLLLIFTCVNVREITRNTTVAPIKPSEQRAWTEREENMSYQRGGPRGYPMRGRPMHHQHQNETEMYLEDDYYEDPIQHTRKDWARSTHRKDVRLGDRQTRR
eukprot:Seg1680.10 transcript_id=Seg1680.10/GoldUCD/mRNA.D3Y31 product="CD63 antigen" protein_id=Seg1680.10/GoldUCD/D3Y31